MLLSLTTLFDENYSENKERERKKEKERKTRKRENWKRKRVRRAWTHMYTPYHSSHKSQCLPVVLLPRMFLCLIDFDGNVYDLLFKGFVISTVLSRKLQLCCLFYLSMAVFI